jgi:uncharacterized membrane protein
MHFDKPGPADRFRARDAVEVALGGSIMAFPSATTEEIWKLGAELGAGRVIMIALASLLTLAIFIYVLHPRSVAGGRKAFYQRLVATYGMTLAISAALLFGVDRLPLFSDFGTAVTRMILVAFPASFAATVVDSLGGPGNE